jgi:uncharacterized phage-associated protein
LTKCPEICYYALREKVGDMIRFRFNEKKTTQVAAILIAKHGGEVNYTKLIKLLYLVDREALARWHRPVTGDHYVSMKNGPVLSRTYDLINYAPDPDFTTVWYDYIEKKAFDVALKKTPATDELSKAELNLLEEIYERYKNKDWREMIRVCHDICTEWKHPGDTSVPIRVNDILSELRKTREEIADLEEEITNINYVKSLISPTN